MVSNHKILKLYPDMTLAISMHNRVMSIIQTIKYPFRQLLIDFITPLINNCIF